MILVLPSYLELQLQVFFEILTKIQSFFLLIMLIFYKAKFIDMNDTNLLNSLVNKDYIIKKTDELKKLRKRLMEIRKFISDDYAEKIGSNISCIQQ
jgi:hypothetical protein